MEEGGKDDYQHVVATLQKGISNMKHLTSQSLGKLQDGVEEGLSQAEDDLKNAKGDLAEARETELKAEKRRAPLLNSLVKAKDVLKNASSMRNYTPALEHKAIRSISINWTFAWQMYASKLMQ